MSVHDPPRLSLRLFARRGVLSSSPPLSERNKELESIVSQPGRAALRVRLSVHAVPCRDCQPQCQAAPPRCLNHQRPLRHSATGMRIETECLPRAGFSLAVPGPPPADFGRTRRQGLRGRGRGPSAKLDSEAPRSPFRVQVQVVAACPPRVYRRARLGAAGPGPLSIAFAAVS
eukprot:2234023-Rhodomonas_salina.2